MKTRHAYKRTLITSSYLETRELARRLAVAAHLPAVIALAGNLGAGKTEFVKGLGWGLGLAPDSICSATFVIVCEYGTSRKLIHVDAYRLQSSDELEAIGWEEIITGENSLVAVEWADRIADRLPPKTLWVEMELLGPTERKITLQADPTSPWGKLLVHV
jgi:tRNA threonylcarbamoyladenosine biosynthesis protein TsaE